LETYLQLKNDDGALADYSQIDNEAILRKYGIEIPENAFEINDAGLVEDNPEATASPLINAENQQAEESKHLL